MNAKKQGPYGQGTVGTKSNRSALKGTELARCLLIFACLPFVKNIGQRARQYQPFWRSVCWGFLGGAVDFGRWLIP